MAPTFRPYQSVGRGLNQLNLPEGAEAQEASRTMTVLSRSMDQMSTFFFRKADEQAQVEGQKFGVQFMTDQKVKQALKGDQDIFDLPQFGNTTFGNTARKSALAVLENKITVNATKDINDIIFNGQTNSTAPGSIEAQINSTILGYVDSIKVSAPILSEKLSASLQLAGAGEYDRYRKAYAKSQVGTTNAEGLIALITKMNGVDSRLQGLLSDEAINFNIENISQSYKKDVADIFSLGLKTGPTLTQVGKLNEKYQEFFKKAFRSEVFSSEIANPGEDKLPYMLIGKIKDGTFQSEDKELNAIINVIKSGGQSSADPTGQTVPIPNFQSLSQLLLADINQELQMDKSLAEAFNLEKNEASIKIDQDVNPIYRSTDPLRDDELEVLKKSRKLAYKYGLDNRAEKLDEIIEANSVPVDQRFAPNDDDGQKNTISLKIAKNIATFEDLKLAQKFLTVGTYLEFYDQIDANFEPRMTRARRKIVIATNYDPGMEKSGELRDFNKLDKQKYNIIYNELERQYSEAKRTKTEFDPETAVAEIIASKMDDLKQGDKKIQLDKYAPTATYFFRLAEKYAQKKGIAFDINEFVIPGDNLATVTNYYNLLSGWRNFDSEDDVPEAFRFAKVRKWLANDEWLSQINSRLNTMEKFLTND